MLYQAILDELDEAISSMSPELWVEERDPDSPQYWLGSLTSPRRSILISVIDLDRGFKIVVRETQGLTNIHDSIVTARDEIVPALSRLRASVREFLYRSDRPSAGL